MTANPSVAVATFTTHPEAEAAVKKLTSSGFPAATLSVIGRGYHTEDKVVGFFNTGERVKVWGSRGAMWGGLWGLLLGGLFIWTPVVGPVMIIGYLGAVAASTIEGAVLAGGISALFAALASIGIPKDSVLHYETAIRADSFLVMVHGNAEQVEHARAVLAVSAVSVDVHDKLVPQPAGQAAA